MKIKAASFGNMQNNCYLITDEKTNESALVDCSEYNSKMIDLIGNTDLKYILLTHGHFDHIGGAAEIKKQFGCEIVISEEDAPMLSSSKLSLAAFCGAAHNNCKADVLVSDGDVIALGSIDIKVMSTPGHTKGSVCYIAEDCLFSGDTLFFCSCGRTDFPGGSSYEMAQSLQKLSLLEGNLKVCTGHERQSTLDFERKNNPYMR